jgi:plastocyanin
MPQPMPVARAALLVLSVTLLAGCGSAPRTVRAQDGRVSFKLDDFSITPQKVRVPPGRVTFTASDVGRTTHTLRVSDGVHDLLSITTLHPGQRGSASATLRRGTYKLYCAIANHEQLGMSGSLVVR